MADQDVDMEQLRRNQLANAFGGGAQAKPAPAAPAGDSGPSLWDVVKTNFSAPLGSGYGTKGTRVGQGK